MSTIADKLTVLQDTKTLIKEAIVGKGQDIPDGASFASYAEKIADIQPGVTSFHGRAGDVVPMAGDYTAEMVGARASDWTPSASDVGAIPAGAVGSVQLLTESEYNALASKNASTLYLIKE